MRIPASFQLQATNGSRTRDLNITNVALYHLSYSSMAPKKFQLEYIIL